MPKKTVSKTKKITPSKKVTKTKAVKKATPKKPTMKKPITKKALTKKIMAKPKKVLPKGKATKATLKKPAVKRAKVDAVPKGFSSITPHLVVSNASKAVEFYKKAFSAKESYRMQMPEGKLSHVELKIGDSKIMLADEAPERGAKSPESFGGSAVSIHLYTKDVDKMVKSAVDNGAKLVRPVENMFYGDRAGMVMDPFGHTWHVATHVENVSPMQLKKRAMELYNKKA